MAFSYVNLLWCGGVLIILLSSFISFSSWSFESKSCPEIAAAEFVHAAATMVEYTLPKLPYAYDVRKAPLVFKLLRQLC